MGPVRDPGVQGLSSPCAAAVPRQNCSSTTSVCLCSNISRAAHHFSFLSFLFASLREAQLSPFPRLLRPAQPCELCPSGCLGLLRKTLFPQKSQHLSQLNPSSWLRIENISVRKPFLNTDKIMINLMCLY